MNPQALAELKREGLVAETGPAGKDVRWRQLTEEGLRVFNRLVEARRARLAELWPECSPQKREEVAELIRRPARELVREAKTGVAAPSGSQNLPDRI